MGFKRMIGKATAAFFAAAMFSCSAAAAQAAASSPDIYRETVLPLSQGAESSFSGFTVQPDGKIDYFIMKKENGIRKYPSHYQSPDGGKSWNQANMDWFSKAVKKYSNGKDDKPGSAVDFYITSDGAIYSLVISGKIEQKENDTTWTSSAHKVLVYSNGQAREIPNLELGFYGAKPMVLAGVENNGDVVILQQAGDEEAKDVSAVCVYDCKTGALKKKTPYPDQNWSITAYKNGIAYGVAQDSKNNQANLVAFDIQTGKQTLSVAVPASKNDNQRIAVGVSDDGTVFVASAAGIYRLKPGDKSLVKLIDGASCRLGSNTLFDKEIACTNAGEIYIPTRTYNFSNEDDPNNYKQGALCLYSPK